MVEDVAGSEDAEEDEVYAGERGGASVYGDLLRGRTGSSGICWCVWGWGLVGL